MNEFLQVKYMLLTTTERTYLLWNKSNILDLGRL